MSFLNEILSEKKATWGVKKTGEFEGMTREEIRAEIKTLHGKKEHTKEDTRRLKAANFALRAKKAGGKKWKGVTAESVQLDEETDEELLTEDTRRRTKKKLTRINNALGKLRTAADELFDAFIEDGMDELEASERIAQELDDIRNEFE